MTPFHHTQTQATPKTAAVLGLPAVHSVQDNVFRKLRQREEERAKRYILTTPARPLRDRFAEYLFAWSRNTIQQPRTAIN